MKPQYTIRHAKEGDLGRFDSMTEATLMALWFPWRLEDWSVEVIEGEEA